jgi:hypothetical protein
MAGEVTIKVDDTGARLKLGRVPVEVRNNLRNVIPGLTRRLAALVNSKISSELKSHKTLAVAEQMVENTKEIYGRVQLTSPSANGLLPTYLEYGTKAHEIAGNPILAFYWDKVGANVFFRSVHHPGTKAYQFMSRSFAEMRNEVVQKVAEAARAGARNA